MDKIDREILLFDFNKADMKMREYRNKMRICLREYIKEVCRAKNTEQIDFNFDTGYPVFLNKAINVRNRIAAVKVSGNVILCCKGKEWIPIDHLHDVRIDEVMDSVEVYDRIVKDAV